jgi:hypothetical protein
LQISRGAGQISYLPLSKYAVPPEQGRGMRFEFPELKFVDSDSQRTHDSGSSFNLKQKNPADMNQIEENQP